MQLNLFLFLSPPALLTQIPIVRACEPPSSNRHETTRILSLETHKNRLTKVILFKYLFDMLNEAPFSIVSGETVSVWRL